MIETWVRPGQEGAIQERFEDSVNKIKEVDATDKLYLAAELEIAENLVELIKNYRDSLNGEAQRVQLQPQVKKEVRKVRPQTTELNPRKRKNQQQIKVEESKSDLNVSVPEQEVRKTYELYRLGDTWMNGSFRLQAVNGWLDKKISDVAAGSPEKAAALSAMVSYLRGEITPLVNGRAVTRHSAKKLNDKTVAIDGRREPIWTLKPDAIPSVTIKGKELAHVRITYVTLGDKRVIVGIFSDRKSYDRATK